ncbi:MAG: hypothetical protein AB1509_15260 [Chloroflexota bacterium]
MLTLRLQFSPRQNPADLTAQLLELIQSAPVDEVMFFYFGEEQNNGHETLEEIQTWIEHSRPFRQALKERGIAVSLNPWHTLLHGDSGRRLKDGQHWQTMVDPNGHAAQAVVCPLDPDWQAYYLETLNLYAREGFRVVWIDDDIRYHNHAPLDWGGCFCPLHVAEFNHRAGTNASREEIVRACLAPGEPHPWREIWFDMWQDTQLEFLAKCRTVLEAGGARMGLMSSLMEAHAAEGRRWADWWKTFGGDKAPVHRPHFWGYSDAPGSHLIFGIAHLDQNRSIQPADIESGPEIENFPYGRWNKSYRQTFAQMAVALTLGATNLNVSLFDFMGNRLADDPTRADFLKRIRPNLEFLQQTFPSVFQSAGVGLPWSEDLGRRIHLPEGATWRDLQVHARGWAYWLGAAGMAFSAREQDAVNAVAGASVWGLDDDQIRRLLSRGLLLDGVAAHILAERGFGAEIGIRSARMVTQNELLYSIERSATLMSRHIVSRYPQISVNNKPHTRRLLQADLAPEAQIVSQLLDPRQNPVGHGAFTFENSLGGRVAVVPWDASVSETPMMDTYRAEQLRALVRWLARDAETGSVSGGAWLVPQFLAPSPVGRGRGVRASSPLPLGEPLSLRFRGASHGSGVRETWRAVVWNASPDELDSFTLHRPADLPAPTQAWHLLPSGARLPVALHGDHFQLSQPMHQWELVVIGNW